MVAIIGIYKITSASGKIYIGQSVNIKKRHDKYKRLNCKNQPKLYNSINKHGWDKHNFEIIHQCNKEDLNRLEVYYIQNYNSFNTKHGLNLVSGGGANRVLSKEARLKISQSMIGDQRNKGRKHSAETRLKISLAKKNQSKETRRKIGDARRGTFLSLDTRIKISIANKGRVFSKEHLLNLSLGTKGKKKSDETRLRISEAKRGKPWTENRRIAHNNRKNQ